MCCRHLALLLSFALIMGSDLWLYILLNKWNETVSVPRWQWAQCTEILVFSVCVRVCGGLCVRSFKIIRLVTDSGCMSLWCSQLAPYVSEGGRARARGEGAGPAVWRGSISPGSSTLCVAQHALSVLQGMAGTCGKSVACRPAGVPGPGVMQSEGHGGMSCCVWNVVVESQDLNEE